MLLKDKKRLLREHTHFLVDSRVMQHIYNLLGTTFTSRDHRPVPIELGKFIGAASAPATDAASVAARGGKLAAMVQRAVDSAYFRKSGNTLSIRIGHTGMTAAQVKENIIAGVPAAVEKLSKAWREVHSIHIKTSDSAALPVYSQDSNEMAQYVAQRAKSKPAKASNDAAAPADGSKSEVATTGADSKKKKAAAKAAATPQETKSPASSAKAATSSKTKATKVLKKSPQSAAAPGKTTRTTKAKTAGATGKAARRALLKA